MGSLRYVKHDVWFAWRPVRTTNNGWVWGEFVYRTVDERDEIYLGLLPQIHYEYIENKI